VYGDHLLDGMLVGVIANLELSLVPVRIRNLRFTPLTTLATCPVLGRSSPQPGWSRRCCSLRAPMITVEMVGFRSGEFGWPSPSCGSIANLVGTESW